MMRAAMRSVLVFFVLALSCRRDDAAVVATKDPTPIVSSSASASMAPAPAPSIDPSPCPWDRDCGPGCCDDGELCNGGVCYQPLLCGGTLPECPPLTHCEHYAKELAGYACKVSTSNAEFCERMRYGVHILQLRVGAKPPSGADGGCLPELGDVHRGGRHWYEAIGKSP